MFGQNNGEVIQISNPTKEERREFFQDLILNQTTKVKAGKKPKGKSGQREMIFREQCPGDVHILCSKKLTVFIDVSDLKSRLTLV